MVAKPPTAYRLAERLFQLGCLESPPSETYGLTADEARDCIVSHCVDWAVCDSVPPYEGKSGRAVSFAVYFERVFGEPLHARVSKRVKGAA
jgi:hypothetical protein